MSKTHYIAIAKIVKRSADKRNMIDSLVHYFKGDNELFDESKFKKACGVEIC